MVITTKCHKIFICSFTSKSLVSRNSTVSFRIISEYCVKYRAAADSQENFHRLLCCHIRIWICILTSHQLLLLDVRWKILGRNLLLLEYLNYCIIALMPQLFLWMDIFAFFCPENYPYRLVNWEWMEDFHYNIFDVPTPEEMAI